MILQLVLIQVITFVGIVIALRGILYRNTHEALGRLQDLQKETLEREEVLKQEIVDAKQMHEEEVRKAKEEAARIVQEEKEKAQKKSKEVIASAEAEADRVLSKATVQLEKLKSELSASMGKKAAIWAEAILKSVLSLRVRDKFHQEISNELIEELKGAKHEWIHDVPGIKTVEIVSASPLTQPQKDSITSIFSSYLDKNVKFDFSTDENLIGGLIIDLNKRTIDGSLRNKISQSLKEAKENDA